MGRHGMVILGAVAALVVAAPAASAKPHGAKPACSRAAAARDHPRPARRAHCATARRHRVARRLPGRSDAFGPGLPGSLLAPPSRAPAPAPVAPAPQPTPAAPTPTPTPAPAPSTPLGRAVQVAAGEFWLTLSRLEVAAGAVRVEYNTYPAEDPHSLVLVRADGSGPVYHFAQQDAKTVVDQSLQLSRGTWVLFCNLADHEAKGMKTELTVR